jgi:hypothetical protein
MTEMTSQHIFPAGPVLRADPAASEWIPAPAK